MSTVEAAAANLAVHFTWVQSRTPGMRVSIGPDLVLADCGMPCDTFNTASHARLTDRTAGDRIREACAWFEASGHPFSWWVAPGDEPAGLGRLLSDAGLTAAETELAMAAPLGAVPFADLAPGGLEIRRVRSPAELRAFAQLSAANWSPPDLMVERFYTEGASALLLAPDSPLRLYLGYLEDQPVATSELTLTADAAGVYNISTGQPWRGRGIGTALTAWAMREGSREGRGIAVLQAAPAGVGVYRRLGFEAFGEITEYKPPG